MKLDAIDWNVITRQQAARLRPAAARRERAVAERFNRDEATEEEFRAATLLEEDLHVFALTGVKPADDPSRK